MNPELLKYFATTKGLDAATMTFLVLGWTLVEKKEWLALVCFLGAIASYVVTVIFKHDQAVKDQRHVKKVEVASNEKMATMKKDIKANTKKIDNEIAHE